jgi:hypothetical protein
MAVTKLIKIKDETYYRIKKKGEMGDTFDIVLNKVLDAYEKWEKRK